MCDDICKLRAADECKHNPGQSRSVTIPRHLPAVRRRQRPACGRWRLVLDEVLSRQDRGRLIGEPGQQPCGPGFGERNAVDRRHDVDAQRRHADLEDQPRRTEVRLGQVAKLGSECGLRNTCWSLTLAPMTLAIQRGFMRTIGRWGLRRAARSLRVPRPRCLRRPARRARPARRPHRRHGRARRHPDGVRRRPAAAPGRDLIRAPPGYLDRVGKESTGLWLSVSIPTLSSNP